MNTKKKVQTILHKVGVPVTVFCRKIGISPTAFYRWQNNDLQLSQATENKIKHYITRLEAISE